MRWNFETPEKCRTKDCSHIRCKECYSCDDDEIRLQHCDGAMIGEPGESEAVEFCDWDPQPGDTRCVFPCPLKPLDGCDNVFLSSEHAAQPAEIHDPIVSIPCPFPGCNRHFARGDDKALHLLTHTAPVLMPCPMSDCGQKFSSEDAKNFHLIIHFPSVIK
jgi:hypothetical protein